MSPASHEGRRSTTTLSRRAGPDADAATVAQAFAGIWREIDAALAPIVGSCGVAALHQRCFHLTTAPQHWRVPSPADGVQPQGPAHLLAMLRNLDGDRPAAAGDAFLHNFHALLTSLVGPALTGRLLQPVWADPASQSPPRNLPS